MRVQNDATSLNDKLRIANKVNSKYLESRAEKSKLLEELELEMESNDTNSLLSLVENSANKNAPPGKKENGFIRRLLFLDRVWS